MLGKLFNSIMNKRIVTFLNTNGKLNKEQIGFKEGHRTADHIFVIKSLIQKYKKVKKNIFACFVDLEKAFDSISIQCLLYKLQQIGVSGYMYRLIKNMYSKIKLRVDVETGLTREFMSDVGVRQGDNMSPTLFNIYINDIPDVFSRKQCHPVQLRDSYLNCLLYADDLVILSETEVGLQNCINSFQSYCDKWGLKINTTKTKTIIFNNKKSVQDTFLLNGVALEMVKEITYLGLVLNQSGSFESTKNMLYKKGLKSLFKLKSMISPMPKVDTCLHLFNHIVKPILLYGGETWSYSMFGERNFSKLCTTNLEKSYLSRTSPVEKAQLKFCKILLKLPTKASNVAPYGELGVYPLYIDCISRTLKYWSYIENHSTNSILKEALDCCKELHSKGTYTWYSFITNLQSIVGLNQNIGIAPNPKNIKLMITNLKKRYENHWHSVLNDDATGTNKSRTKLRTYRSFKRFFGLEKYLSLIKNEDIRACLTKFRLSAHKLRIERGRYLNIKPEERICEHCNLNAIEDEKHFVLECPLYDNLRKKLLSEITKVSPYFKQLDYDDQFCWIMSNNLESIIPVVAEYLFNATEIRKEYKKE